VEGLASAQKKIASKRLVLPAPFSPRMRLRWGEKAKDKEEKLRKKVSSSLDRCMVSRGRGLNPPSLIKA